MIPEPRHGVKQLRVETAENGMDEACANMFTTKHKDAEKMPSTTFTVRVDPTVKKRLEKLARSTGRTRSFLAADALSQYLDVNERHVAGIRKAVASLDRGQGVPHDQVKAWVDSWGGKSEPAVAKHS
jgi:RHH-type rel operon transcriptional repressor/antitoxin RelB